MSVCTYIRVCERDEPLYQCDEVYCVTLSVTNIQMTNQCYLGCRNIFRGGGGGGEGARLWFQEIRGERSLAGCEWHKAWSFPRKGKNIARVMYPS